MFASFFMSKYHQFRGLLALPFSEANFFFSTKIGVGKRERVVEKSDKKLHKKDGVQAKK